MSEDYEQAAKYWQMMYEQSFRERTCEIEHMKSGPLYDVWRYTCCGYEHAESVSESEIAQNYCPNCGAKVVNEWSSL